MGRASRLHRQLNRASSPRLVPHSSPHFAKRASGLYKLGPVTIQRVLLTIQSIRLLFVAHSK